MKVHTQSSSSSKSSDDSDESYTEISFVKSVCEDGDIEQKLFELKCEHTADIKLLKEELASHKEHTKSLLRALLCLENEENLQVKSGQDILDALKCLVEESKNFGIPELYKKARILATNAVKAKPSHSVACLKAYELYPDLIAAADGENLALVAIRKEPRALLLRDESLTLLSSRMLENILKDEKLQTDEYELFEIVQLWSKVNEANFPEALELMKYVKLEFMSRQELLKVENSPLVSTDRLLSAYKAQSLIAEKTGFSCKKNRHNSLANYRNWKGLNSGVMVGNGKRHKTHVLDCDPLQSGNIYKWSIKLDEGSDSNVYFGVVANKESLECGTFLGGQTCGWSVHANSGAAYHDRSGAVTLKDLKFGPGSKVTFTLDLTGVGTLSASTDGGKAEQLFSGMLAKASSLGASGFLPAASVLHSHSKAQFLGFE